MKNYTCPTRDQTQDFLAVLPQVLIIGSDEGICKYCEKPIRWEQDRLPQRWVHLDE